MAIVTGPFMSAWASGSIGKNLTVKDMHNKRFVMAHHVPLHRELKGGTKKWALDFARRIARYQLFLRHLDKVEVPRSFVEV